jgi:hypothetical protein
MSYTRLDDGFWMHPAILTAGNTAAGIFARLLSYCGCYMTDGQIPEGVATTIVGRDTKALDALTGVGLVVRLHGDDGGLLIPDFLDYNRSKADYDAYVASRRNGGRAKAGRNGQ